MTVVAAPVPGSPSRVRIAITSPDILAQIRQAFASRNLAVEIVSLPYVEVAVSPAAGPGAGGSARVAPAALERVVGGQVAPVAAPAPRRLCAEYRLSVVGAGVDDGPRLATEAAVDRPRPAAALPPARDTEPDTVADGARRVAELSERQHEVMALVSRGARNTEIAERLRLSEKTVKNHINRIFRALGVSSRVEAVLVWQRHRPAARPVVPAARTGPTPRGAAEPHRPQAGRRPGPAGTS
ncbi:DNA-binding CsgD family transcriptional regulator [Streptacidiphilus sp. MAP12-33]|uniref:helix-turn-helix transcriptional regulator n=1 Tax=Streptacidiphilus sp. MAP12-33 TaxID=3156266 RepID=UPI00351333C6